MNQGTNELLSSAIEVIGCIFGIGFMITMLTIALKPIIEAFIKSIC